MDPLLRLVIVTTLSFLAGSLPTAVIISRRFFGFDIRERGSGNMGSTNAFRVLGVKWGLLVQVIDITKGVLAVTVIAYLFQGEPIPFPNNTPFEDITLIRVICGIAAVMGHIWSPWVGFRGGKGINTAAGMLLGVAPVEVAVIFSIFVITVAISGYVSLGSILAAMALPTTMAVRYNVFHVPIEGYHTIVLMLIGLSLLVIYAHRQNIQRLLEGKENKFEHLRLVNILKKGKP
ncbi:MAG: glycerol-3-phosphate 1-O-acyltransferase PlsY [Bacteroidota bacterium]|nr:glycerol-3-phosphate 1-O-acyltransferase PlsY [Candidatus Kapabacteria bacterium]MDW8220886.1 glycerol-3-phosphate 1-O-acyltransferase PlsY [Bacteroidota bacterium]